MKKILSGGDMIDNFTGKYKWLSNFERVEIEYKGKTYPSTEHAFVSEKNDSEEWREFCADPNLTCVAVKKAGNATQLRNDWEEIKTQVMLDVCTIKFKKEPYRTMLLETGTQELVEGTTWGDKVWGIDIYTGEGENRLGIILMKIRDELIKGEI